MIHVAKNILDNKDVFLNFVLLSLKALLPFLQAFQTFSSVSYLYSFLFSQKCEHMLYLKDFVFSHNSLNISSALFSYIIIFDAYVVFYHKERHHLIN